jgi:hypothetical protein
MLVCIFVTPAFAESNQNTPEGRYGTYKLTDMPGYSKSLGLPLCDPIAENILDKWRGPLVIKYSKGTVWVNEEQWILNGDYPLTNVVARRPADSKINGRIEATFKPSHRRGLAHLVFSDDGRKCQTAVAFIGRWTKP